MQVLKDVPSERREGWDGYGRSREGWQNPQQANIYEEFLAIKWYFYVT